MQLVSVFSCNRQTGQVPFYIGHENRNTCVGQAFRQNLQSHGFARPRGARDEAMAVGVFQQKLLRIRVTLAATAYKNATRFCHVRP